jgi:hypothetical protein
MMAPHRFDGKWRYFERSNGQPLPVQKDDMNLFIPNEAGDVDEKKSNQGGKTLDGTAGDDEIKLFRFEPGTKRTLNGTLRFEKVIAGQLFLIIAGRFSDEDTKKAQNQGDWIITKP